MADKYRVPKSEQREYERLVARANSRIRANLVYIQQENIDTSQTKRTLLGQYEDRSEWASEKATFHNRVLFDSAQEYVSYKRHVAQWGGIETGRKIKGRYEILTPAASVEGRKEGYIQKIIESLTQSAITNNIEMTADGKLPGNIGAKLRDLNLEQLSHFFRNDEPVADLEYLPYSEVDFNGVTDDEFVEKVDSIINSLKQIYPHANMKRYRNLINQGIESKQALQMIYPKATPRQITYYNYSGNLPAVYTAPKRKTKRKTKRKK